MDMPYTYQYPHPALTADCILLGIDAAQTAISVLLIERKHEPYQGCWAFPGGFMNIDETIEQCAARELHEETGLSGINLMQLRVYSAVHRDSRERVVSVAFVGLTRCDAHSPQAADDAARVQWFSIKSLPPLAFDHAKMLADAQAWLRQQLHLVQSGYAPNPWGIEADAIVRLL